MNSSVNANGQNHKCGMLPPSKVCFPGTVSVCGKSVYPNGSVKGASDVCVFVYVHSTIETVLLCVRQAVLFKLAISIV